MELCLVKDNNKITPVNEVFSRTVDHNSDIRNVQSLNRLRKSLNEQDDSNSVEVSDSEDEDDRTVLTLADLPVAITSLCKDVNGDSERFAKRVERMLTFKPESENLANIKLDVIMPNDPNSLVGYFLLSGCPDGLQTDTMKKLDDEFGQFGLKFKVELGVCHLPNMNAAGNPESLIFLTGEAHSPRDILGSIPVRVPLEMKMLMEPGSGFIYSKLNVKFTLEASAVARVYECSHVHQPLLYDKIFNDLEIECKTGEIVTCHRAILAGTSSGLRNKFREMQKEKKVGPWKLDMKISKEGVEALLEYIYCRDVTKVVLNCDLAIELLVAAIEYKLWELGTAVEEVIMAKCSSDSGYFSVKNGVDLFLYARNVEKLNYLRDKGVRILQNYLKTAGDQTLESKEYQDLFEKQPEVAMELSKLYLQIK